MAAMMALGTLEKLAQSSTGKMIEGKIADKLGIVVPNSAASTAAGVTAPTVPTATTPLWSIGPGRDGRDGRDGKDGKDGTPDVQALQNVLEKNLQLSNMSNLHPPKHNLFPHPNIPHVNFPHLSSHLSSTSAPGSTDDELTEQINNLQKLENDKYIALDVLLKSNPSPDNVAQQEAIINDITAISTLRSNLFDTLLNNASSHSKLNEQMNSNLENKNTIKTLKENSLNLERAALEAEDTTISNARRMVDINTYYHKQYAARVKIMKLIVLICFVIIFFIVLMHLGWLPQELVTVIVVITLLAGVIYIGYLVNDMYQRSKLNFDEYNFPFDSSKFGSQLSKSTKSAKASTDQSCSLYNSIASSAATVEDSISSKATELMNEVNGGTPDPSQPSSSLTSANANTGSDSGATATPSVQTKLSESFIPLMSRMDRRQFNSNNTLHPAAYDTENNFGKI
jgi:hypothetical protein